NTSSGSVRGQTLHVLNRKIHQFLNIPYAEPPLGPLRFAPPLPLKAPKQKVGLKPVMFWIYGGALSLGSIFQDVNNMSILAANDVVVVAVNYRVGPLGFLYGGDQTAPGNAGYYDMVLGLKWVKENIHNFGGDKSRITIFGPSSGSIAVSALILSPVSKGLFKRAIMQSGSVMYNKDRPALSAIEALQKAKQLAKRLNCDKYDNKWLQYIELMAGVTKDEGISIAPTFMPEMRNEPTERLFRKAVNDLSDEYHNIDVDKVCDHYLNGVHKTNSTQLKAAFNALYGDFTITCPTYLFAINYAKRGPAPVPVTPQIKPHDVWPQLWDKSVIRVKDLNPNDMSLILDNPYERVVRGRTLHVLDTNVDQFVGIPYAEPPVGKHRFAKPEPISKPFPGIIDATKVKNSCMQNPSQFPISPDSPLSEDCLVLNIWTTNTTALKPVMFWIYGGGLIMGSIFQEIYNGSALATKDVVVVSVNYRLGPFGFLYGDREDAPGNVGFYDQLLGLKWVRENIHSFGGDRDQITIFGESAGSWSVSAHILSPLSKGMFQRAIMENGFSEPKFADRGFGVRNAHKLIHICVQHM
ncbi:unnamed protein product, partial [Medioppia subpectinata]